MPGDTHRAFIRNQTARTLRQYCEQHRIPIHFIRLRTNDEKSSFERKKGKLISKRTTVIANKNFRKKGFVFAMI